MILIATRLPSGLNIAAYTMADAPNPNKHHPTAYS
jgi:hypothetical protein